MIRAAFVLPLALMLLAGCGGDGSEDAEADDVTVYEDVRAAFRGTASDGRDAVVVHEAIPGFMRAMLMTLPLADPEDARGLERGDKVRFDLAVGAASVEIRNLERLPDSTRLDLPTTPPRDTTGASSAAPDDTAGADESVLARR